MHRSQYLELNNSKTNGVNDTTHLKNARLESLREIMGTNYLTQEQNDISHLKTARLIGFM